MLWATITVIDAELDHLIVSRLASEGEELVLSAKASHSMELEMNDGILGG